MTWIKEFIFGTPESRKKAEQDAKDREKKRKEDEEHALLMEELSIKFDELSNQEIILLSIDRVMAPQDTMEVTVELIPRETTYD